MSKLPRIVVPLDAQDPASWRAALTCADAICSSATPTVKSVLLLTHAKNQLKHTALHNHIGDRLARILDQGGELPLPSGAKLRHVTMKTARSAAGGAVVIVFFAEDGILDFADGMSGVAGVVAVPDLEDGADAWIERWNALVLGREPKAEKPLIHDPVVERALTSLTRMVNLSTGLLHPRDKAYAEETLRILRANKHSPDAEQVRSWAIRNGWTPDGAKALADAVRKIAKLKNKPSLAGIHDPESRYRRWRAGE